VDSARFRTLLHAPGPFASVYFEDSDGWHGVCAQLAQQGADKSVTADIERAVRQACRPIAGGGRAVVAGPGGVVVDEHLLRPVGAPVVRVSDLPYIVPIVEHGFDQPNYLLAVVDHAGADITAHVNGCRCPEAIDEFTDDDLSEFEAVFVVGEIRSRSHLVATLPDRVGERAIPLQVGAGNGDRGVLGVHDAEEIHRAIDATFLRRQLRVIDHAAARFDAEVGRQSGRAAEGLDAVCSALRRGVVETLIVGNIRDATVVTDRGLTTLAPNAEVLSEQGGAPAKTLRADEALPLFAISAGAALVCTDERIAPADGVAAVLR
jgi:peptide chain release factor subunit 1